MFSKMFNHINLLEKSLDVAWLRNETIAQNIANADTPNYKSKHVEFETMFRQALEDGNTVPTKTTRSGHFVITPSDPLKVDASVVSETHHTMRMDGNNVDIDQEMVEMAENTIQYNTLIQKTSKEFSLLKLAIRGSR